VMAHTDQFTSVFQYSVDEGATFRSCKFSNSTVSVERVYQGSSSKSLVAVIYGSLPSGEGLLTHIDFSKHFPRKCDANDYEMWSPDTPDGKCILGQKEIFSRRKQAANCYNGLDYEVLQNDTSCPCTRDDYECNECYELDGSGNCVETDDCDQDDPPAAAPANCNISDGYFTDDGPYRLVEDTECSGGVELRTHYDCPALSERTGKMMLSVFLVTGALGVVLVACVVLYFKNDKFRDFLVKKVPSLFRPEPSTDYSSLLTDEYLYENAVEEELFKDPEHSADNSADEYKDK